MIFERVTLALASLNFSRFRAMRNMLLSAHMIQLFVYNPGLLVFPLL